MLQEKRGGQFRKRLLVIFVVYMALTFSFNVMLYFLTINYLKTMQYIPGKMGFMAKFNFRQGIINEEIVKNDHKANSYYLKTIQLLNDERGLANPENGVLLLSQEELSEMGKEYIGVYFDLLVRFALTCYKDEDTKLYLEKALEIDSRFDAGSYALKSTLFRILASLSPNLAEPYLLESVALCSRQEKVDLSLDKQDAMFGVVPSGSTLSDAFVNCLLDLAWFYADKDLGKPLAIFTSLLRSSPKLHSLLKLNISEILWAKGEKKQALQFCQQAAMEALVKCRSDVNSAKIAKTGFKNLAKMYGKLGERELQSLCIDQAKQIEVPLDLVVEEKMPSGRNKLREQVLGYYFGGWGGVLFP